MTQTKFNLKEAVQYLGISERTLKRYVKNNKVTVSYESRPNTRPIMIFSKQELDRLKEEKNTSTVKPMVELVPDNDNLSATQINSVTIPNNNLSEILNLIVQKLEQNNKEQENSLAELDFKLTLNLKEASLLSGLSKNYLREQIKQGNLKGIKIGNAWRVSRKNLNEFIETIFN